MKKERKGKTYIEDVIKADNEIKFKKSLKYLYYNILCSCLNECVENENYEKAIVYKDKIKEHLNKSVDELDTEHMMTMINNFHNIQRNMSDDFKNYFKLK